MLEAAHKQLVQIREPKPGTRGANGAAEWQPVMNGKKALRIKCRFVNTASKTNDKLQGEVTADATMLWRKRGTFRLTTEHLVVFDGRGYLPISIDEESSLFGSAQYGRARLSLTKETFPEDQPDGE